MQTWIFSSQYITPVFAAHETIIIMLKIVFIYLFEIHFL